MHMYTFLCNQSMFLELLQVRLLQVRSVPTNKVPMSPKSSAHRCCTIPRTIPMLICTVLPPHSTYNLHALSKLGCNFCSDKKLSSMGMGVSPQIANTIFLCINLKSFIRLWILFWMPLLSQSLVAGPYCIRIRTYQCWHGYIHKLL